MPALTACRLVFLGPVEEAGPGEEFLLHEGRILGPGDVVELARKRSPWKRLRDTERVILGSLPARADILLQGRGILPEHIRFYINLEGGPTDLRPLKPRSVRLNGQPVEALEWSFLHGGEELEIGPWRFRYEVAAGPGPAE